jgi:hypothetical protein
MAPIWYATTYLAATRTFAEALSTTCTDGRGVSRNYALDVLYVLAYRQAAKRIVSHLHIPRGSMSVSYALVVADNLRPPGRPVVRSSAPGAAEYEPGHSERQAIGWVGVGPESRWAATLSVPMSGDQSALLTIGREGPVPAGAPEVSEAMLVIPPGEVDALLTLLRGIVAQARREGILLRRRDRAQDRPG